MAEIVIPITTEEKLNILKALKTINTMEHVRNISYANFATLTGIRETKVRIIINDMVDKGELQQINISTGKVPRYYYVATEVAALLNRTDDAEIK